MEKKLKCPFCGKEKFVEGRQDGYATIGPNKMFTLKGQAVYFVICLECGTIVRSYVKKPQDLII